MEKSCGVYDHNHHSHNYHPHLDIIVNQCCNLCHSCKSGATSVQARLASGAVQPFA